MSMDRTASTVPLSARHLVSLVAGVLLLAFLTACGGGGSTPPPPPDPDAGVLSVMGKVVLPNGAGVDLAALKVTTALGTYPVGVGGEFEADVFGGARTEIGVETASGALLLLGVNDGNAATISAATTAEALLYYALGGMWLPAEQQDKVRGLLTGAPAANGLTEALERQLRAGGNGLSAPDADLLAALANARAAVLGDSMLNPALASLAVQAAGGRGAARGEAPATVQAAAMVTVAPAAVDGSNIIIEPSTSQAGVEVLHNPSGAGVVAQNSYRRPAALLAYEVSWANGDGVVTEVDPPLLTERVEVPSTGQLEFFNALLDALTGSSPFSPVLSPPLNLAGHSGASRTTYRLVLVGPSATDATSAVMNDPRFAGFRDDWQEIMIDKSVELFLDDLLLPLMEVYGLGRMAKVDAANLKKMRERVRIVHDQHLAGLGVYLTQGQAGYARGLKFVLDELATNRMYRLEMMKVVKDALELSDQNKAAIDAMESRLTSRASASAIAAAVQGVLVSGDIAKIMHDLVNSPVAVDWTAVTAPALFALSPARATVTRTNSSVRFSVLPKGQTNGNYRYRWSTSGHYGELSDLLQDGRTLDTDQRDVWYFHNSPPSIKATDHDTITVEVFEVPAGANSIPAGAQPVARMAAEVSGDDRIIDSRISVVYGTTPSGMYRDGAVVPCVEMVLRFKAEPGAKSYLVSTLNVGGQGHELNPNQDFRLRGPNHTLLIDPNARKVGSTVPDGYTRPYYGTCNWGQGGTGRYVSQPIYLGAANDQAKGEFVVYLFVMQDLSSLVSHTPEAYDLARRVDLWTDWVKDATFEVKVNR